MPEQKDRIESPTARGIDAGVLKYTASIAYDRRLYRQDIAGSIAHARMLAKQGIILGDDAQSIVSGLEDIRDEIERGDFPFREELEDIHLNIEARLQEKIGEAAGRLHTARSRNDQIATDMRLFVIEACDTAVSAIRDLQIALLDVAEENRNAIMPGYTHLQRAQPVLFAHHLLAGPLRAAVRIDRRHAIVLDVRRRGRAVEHLVGADVEHRRVRALACERDILSSQRFHAIRFQQIGRAHV